jgi:Uma2 family endonuclease
MRRFNEPQPDLMLLRPRPDFYASYHPGPDDVLLVIEIAESSLRYDRDVKAPLYAAWGVPEYWLADLKHNLLVRYSTPVGGAFTISDRLSRGDTVAPRLLPSCVVPVDAFLIE